jgi:hypothetical protein
MKPPIYLDYSATTPVDPRVAEKMIPWLTEHFGNPASRSHAYGWEAEEAVEEARGHVAALVNCDPKEIIWTSGATEAINLALKGAAHFYKDKGKHLVTVKTEHKATLDTMRELERDGFEVTYLDVKDDGLLDIEAFKAALRPDTSVVSVMFVNNEIGVIQDIEQLGEICRARDHLPCRFRSGDRQGPDRPREAQVDLMSFSAHKTYGPKGMGALSSAASRACASRRRCTGAVTNGDALGHAAHAPDRRNGRGVPHREGRDGDGERADPEASRQAVEGALGDRGGLRQRRHGAPRPAQPQRELQFRRRRIPDHGGQGNRGVVGFGVHVGVARALVRAAGARPQR